MHMTIVLIVLSVLQCSEPCLSLKVPVLRNHGADSEVKNNEENIQKQRSAKFNNENQVPVEYFEYNVPKPNFAIDVAKFHGARNPEQHYRAYPIKPYTNQKPLHLGVHHMLDEDKKIYQPYQQYVYQRDNVKGHIKPSSTNYEIFHPYKSERPALQSIYKDPVLVKIRNDLESNRNRLQNYENEAGKPHITKEEYLESPEESERKLFPQPNIPVRYEIHRPERKPVYYKASMIHNNREHVLNQKLKHPLNLNYVKIRPKHYRPLKNYIQQLKQHHVIKFDDERNEYPQVHPAENNAEPVEEDEGYDIYEHGKEKYTELRNNVDESINKAVKENQPTQYYKLELQNDKDRNDTDDEEFIPVKNYAQVRKTEVTKHLPRKAAFDDAETLEEILNAPRLREAIKSKKAQTVYTEEGYEDGAYDHAGELKHASEHERHGGYLKQNELSGGLYKIPSVLSSYEDSRGSEFKDKKLHGEKWKTDNIDQEEESKDEFSFADGKEQYADDESYKNNKPSNSSYRNKRENNLNNDSVAKTKNKTDEEQENEKREINFEVPKINFSSSFLTESDILKLAKQRIEPEKGNTIKEKYPYYYNNIKGIHKNSPLRYAENLKLIPKKSNGGTEFYDSRSSLECPEVENIDELPEKVKNSENVDDNENNSDETETDTQKEKNFDTINKQPRLKGLGDKIDCFKIKYFGEDPLDSPFFHEEVISNPEPITPPKFAAYKSEIRVPNIHGPHINKIFDAYHQYKDDKSDVFFLLDKYKNDQNKLHKPLIKKNENITTSIYLSPATSVNTTPEFSAYKEKLENIKNNIRNEVQKYEDADILETLLDSNKTISNATENATTYNILHAKKDSTKQLKKERYRRATPFVYEPYKIIRDGQVQESKKTTTSGNVSPLIKQLQSSRVVEKVNKSYQDSEKQVKRNANVRTYIDIGRKDREKSTSTGNNPETTIIDVSIDPRRGEPRYEVRPANHKPKFTPVENKKSMSVEDYKAQTNNEESAAQLTHKGNNENSTQKSVITLQRSRARKTTTVSPSDVLQLMTVSKLTEVQTAAASNTVKKTATTTAPERRTKKVTNEKKESDEENEEEYEEYEDEEIITTSTLKPSFRKRIRTTSTTTEKALEDKSEEAEVPKLRLITRFRNQPTEKTLIKIETTQTPLINNYNEEYDIVIPKYREKKKKSSTSTIVTDTKMYGDDEEDDGSRREEVDRLIGGTENLDDYIPLYEKEAKHRLTHDHSDKYEEDDNNDSDSDDDDDDESGEDEDEEIEEDDEPEVKVTTPEPPKRTLMRTTDAPASTTASHKEKPHNKPIVTRKKIEIHKEIPVNKSSPHISQFKQDIKEIEIVKEIPSVTKKKPQKNTEVLNLYQDDSLAKDINKLGDVEIFNDNIDLDEGPKHGGNYRAASKEDVKQFAELSKPKDTLASQSENTKHVELEEYVPKRMHGGNLKSLSDIQQSRQRSRNSKLIELSDPPIRRMHGGNFRYDNKGRRGGRKNEKIIEVDDDHDDKSDESSSSHESDYMPFNSRYDKMHGGNYRSAKLVQASEATEGTKVIRKDARKNAAQLLNSFAQAAPILTTTPGYILDPSKRMYYYVDS